VRVPMLTHQISRWGRGLAALLLCFVSCLRAQTTNPQPTSLRKRAEIYSRLPLTKFYDTPSPLPPGKPGQLIRATPFDEYKLPVNVLATRILYYSRAANGDLVASSGVVLYPGGKAPDGGWPVISWAHAIGGIARMCAPSLMRNLDGVPFLSMYANLGYAVVATDYAGLGTNFPNGFADAESNAFNVIDSVAAARSAVKGVGSRWVAMGIGEGAMAAVRVAELQHGNRGGNFLGSVAISQVADLEDELGPTASPAPDLPLLLAHGIKALNPHFKPEEILSAEAMPLYEKEGEECGVAGTGKAAAAGMLAPKWQSNKFLQEYLSRNRLGELPADAPLLIVSGEEGARLVATMKAIRRMCSEGDHLFFQRYPEGNPAGVIGDSVRDQMAWIQDRFANRPARTNCSSQR